MVVKVQSERKPIAIYDYTDEAGKILFQVCRYEPKDFRQRRSDGNGGYVYNLDGVRRVPYRLPELLKAPMQDFIYIVEGEKDADRLISLGLPTTTNPGGANKWKSEYNQHLRGRLVAICGDNDEPGRRHVRQVADSLFGVASLVRVVDLPDLPNKGDISWWFEHGGTKAELIRLTDAAPDFDPAETDAASPNLVCLADVESLPIEWFWFNRMAMGMLTLIEGDPGLGKSFLTLDMASRVSTGALWPDSNGVENRAPKGAVVILTAEDDLPHVVRPRLDSMGADCSKIVALEGVKIKDDEGRERKAYFNLQRDLPALRKAVQSQQDTKLVIIDPLSAYLGGKIDSHKDADVRSVLLPLVELAEQCGVAIIGIMHLNKNTGGKAIYRGLGSIAFTAAARTVWLVTEDQDDPKRRLFMCAKKNILIEPTGLAFSIIDGKGVVFENEPVTITADEALETASNIEAPALNQAKQWLSEQLPPGKSTTATEIYALAKEQGIKTITLKRAKKELGVVSYALSNEGKVQWFWRIDQ